MYRFEVLNQDLKLVAAVQLNDVTGASAVAQLSKAEAQGWQLVNPSPTSGSFIVTRPEGMPVDQEPCFGSEFEGMISVAIPMETGYRLDFYILEGV